MSADGGWDGAVVGPAVEALACLFAEPAGAHHLAQDRGRPELLADLAVQVLEDGEAHVEADEVRELERPHRVAVAELHRAVDVRRRGDACLEHPHRFGAEAMRMLEGGVASVVDIDRAMELGYRHPMGPLKLTDLVGLDVRLAILEHLHREVGEQFRPPTILRQMVRAGRLGKKVGLGFYRWTDAGAEPADVYKS